MTQDDGLKLLQYNVTKYTKLLYRIVTSGNKMTVCTSKIVKCFCPFHDLVFKSAMSL